VHGEKVARSVKGDRVANLWGRRLFLEVNHGSRGDTTLGQCLGVVQDLALQDQSLGADWNSDLPGNYFLQSLHRLTRPHLYDHIGSFLEHLDFDLNFYNLGRGKGQRGGGGKREKEKREIKDL